MNFAQQCSAALDAANRAAHPFVPSLAQMEAALDPVVRDLAAMPADDARRAIRATFRHEGLMPVALAMFKDRS